CFESAILLAIAILSIELPHDHINSHTLEGYNFQAEFWNLELMRHFFANDKMMQEIAHEVVMDDDEKSCERFLVDDTPSGVHTNLEQICIPYSKDQAMGVYSSVWRRVKTEPPMLTIAGFITINSYEHHHHCLMQEHLK
ncbi:hypothetical protein M8C21_005947, partial [Ambrosia artemisiifolia]